MSPSDKTVVRSDYQRTDVRRLASYAEREPEATMRDRHGQEMDDQDLERLAERSDRHQMSRHIVVSPANADALDREQMSEATKRSLRESIGQRDGVDYGYSVHMDGGDRPHAHVVATGQANQRGDPLWMDEADLQELREQAHDHAQEQERRNALDHALEEYLQHDRYRGRQR
jgi:hypothetical protein